MQKQKRRDAEPVQRYAKQAAPERIGAPATEETKAPRQEAPTPQPEASWRRKRLQERVSQQQAPSVCAKHDKGRTQSFCPVHPDQTRNAPAGRALDEISLSAYTGNVVITGMPGSGTLKLTNV